MNSNSYNIGSLLGGCFGLGSVKPCDLKRMCLFLFWMYRSINARLQYLLAVAGSPNQRPPRASSRVCCEKYYVPPFHT